MKDKLTKKAMRIFEKCFVKINGWKHIPGSSINIFRIDIKKYRGSKFSLEDGTIIDRGDIVAELHIDNINADNMDNSLKTIYEWLNMDLKQLAKVLNTSKDPKYSQIKAIYCTTILYGLISKKGFECFDIKKNLYTRYIAFWENMLRNVFSKNNRKKDKQKRFPKKCWISAEKLIQIS